MGGVWLKNNHHKARELAYLWGQEYITLKQRSVQRAGISKYKFVGGLPMAQYNKMVSTVVTIFSHANINFDILIV